MFGGVFYIIDFSSTTTVDPTFVLLAELYLIAGFKAVLSIPQAHDMTFK